MRAALGYLPDKDAVLAGEDRVSDVWSVIGVTVAEDDRLWRRRVWLFGRTSGRLALLLDFSHGTRSFEPVLMPGDAVRMTLAFYPGSSPLRAVVADVPVSEPESGPLPSFTLEEALADMARGGQSVAVASSALFRRSSSRPRRRGVAASFGRGKRAFSGRG